MDIRSESILQFVHPALDAVMRTASQTPQGFVCIYGVRTLLAEQEAVATGHSETLHSRHLASPIDNLSRAVDVAAVIGGKISFAPGQEKEIFGQIAEQILEAAEILKTPIQWGGQVIGAWTPGVVSTFRDWGHFQLTQIAYP